MKLAVFGAGGIGGYFGARWAAAGLDATLIARGSQLEAIRKNGGEIAIRSALGDARVAIKTTGDTRTVGVCDLVIVATKTWQLDDALPSIKPLIGDKTIILGLQNGVEAAAKIASGLGNGIVIEGTCRIISFVESPGVIRHAGGHPTIIFGARDPGERIGARLEEMREVLSRGAGLTMQLSDNVRVEVWRKFHWFAPLAGVGSVTRSAAGAFRSTPESRTMLVDAMQEVLALAHAHRVPLPDDETTVAMNFVDSLPADATSTMMRDFRDGKRTELETLSGAITRMGSAAGVPTPVNAFIYAALLPQELAARSAK